jgi:hypothetical protein
MDAAGIQAKINLGYGKAARYLGAPYKQYRPTDPLNPLATIMATIMADFDVDPGFSHRAPSKYGNPIFYGLFGATSVSPGDYLIGPNAETYFVAGMEPNKPPLCVQCNRNLTFMRPNPNPVGDGFYGGDIRGPGETNILAGWPGSQLQGTKGEKGTAQLPGDVRMPWISILLPSFAGVPIETTDRASDDLGRFWTISSAELTDLGWRLTAMLADT